MSSTKPLVLITGATGFVGFKALVYALKSNYNVRFAVRSEAKAQKVLNSGAVQALHPSPEQLSWVLVPDMAAPGAYDEATRGVDYVIHMAAPIPSFGGSEPDASAYEEHFIKPAVAGVLGILKSAQKAGTVKRVVATSSVVATIPIEYYTSQKEDRTFLPDERIPLLEGPYPVEFAAYAAAKIAELNESDAYVEKEKPSYDLITIIPGWIFGRDELITDAKDLKSGSTNSVLVNLLLGSQNDFPFNGNAASGDDVARLHVLALDPKVQGSQSFFASAAPFQWESAVDTVKKHYPDAVADGRLSDQGKQPTVNVNVDASKTEKTFNFKFTPFDTVVRDVAGQYLELLA